MDRTPRSVGGLMAAGFAARILLRLGQSKSDFFAHGYSSYITIAHSLLGGQGICVAPGEGCAAREPLYALFVAPFVAMHDSFHGLTLAQSALGALQVWLIWRIGMGLFDRRVALLAAAAMALSPYAVIHDTALQDTVLVNVLALLALRQWIAAPRSGLWTALAAGLWGALATMTNGRMLAALPCWIVGLAAAGERPWQERRRQIV